MNKATIVLASVLSAAPRCGSDKVSVKMEQKQEQAPMPTLSPALEAEAHAVFVGRVLGLGPEPDFISGEEPAYQVLKLEVMRSMKGDLVVGAEVSMNILVVANSPGVSRGEKGIPALNQKTYAPGKIFLIYAKQVGDSWRALPGKDAIVAMP